MATAQKRGFHFPWGNEPNRDEPDAQSLAERIGAAPDDLGRGPFDLSPAADGLATEQLNETEDATEGPHETEAVAEPVAPSPAPPAEGEPVHAEADPASPPVEMVAEPVAEEAPETWPEADRRGTRTTPPAATTPAAQPGAAVFPPKRENPLVAGLVRAMRDAAKVARDEAVTNLRAEAVARGEAIRVEGTTAAAELRKAADADVAEIREWSKAEMVRIREATDARIVARKAQLGADTETAAEAVERLLGQLAATVEAFEAETETFFDHLLAENDPARLAGLAERMPQPPTLDELVAVAAPAAPAAPPQRHRLEVASTPRPETPGADPEAEPEAEADAEPAPVVGAPAEADLVAEPAGEAVSEPEALDADAAAEAEAAALAGLDGQTQLVVSGLAGVAAISRFKGALIRSAGVNAVSVNAGSDGDVLFTITHADNADLRADLQGMTEFQNRVIADDGASLVVVAHDPAA